MAWMSAREKMGHGPSQTGVVGRVSVESGEPSERDKVISETAPAPRDAACEIRSVFGKLPNRGGLNYGEPALKRPVLSTRPARGQIKWRRIELFEFGKHESPCEHVYGGRRAARHECCSWDARSGSPG